MIAAEVLPHQADFLSSTAPITALVGGTGCGKTFSLCLLAVIKSFSSPRRGLLLTGTREQFRKTILDTFTTFGDSWGVDVSYNEAAATLEFRSVTSTGAVAVARCWAGSAAQGAHLRGQSLEWVAGDELRNWRRDVFDVAITRTRRAQKPQLFFTTTPPNPTEASFLKQRWIHEFFVDEVAANPALAQTRRIIAGVRSDANPHVSAAWLDLAANSLGDEAYAVEVEGRFVMSTGGSVYRHFNRALHVTERPARWAEADPRLPVALAFDFNVLGHCVVCQHHQGEVFAFDEIVMPGAETRDLVSEALRRYWNPASVFKAAKFELYGDATGTRRSSTSVFGDWDAVRVALQDAGAPFLFAVPSANPSVSDRITLVNGLLKNHLGKTRLFIHPRCPTLIRDMERVSYLPGSRELDKRTDPRLTHASDALGYLVAWVCPRPARNTGAA